MRRVVLLTVLASLLLAFVVFLFSHFTVSFRSASFVARSGSGLSKISSDLEDQAFISSGFLFKVYSKCWVLVHGCDIVHEGEYSFKKGESFSRMIGKFCSGKTVLKQITIPEGLETREIVELLNNNADLSGDNIVEREEAVVLPNTYAFGSGFDRQKLFQKMRNALNDYINNLWDERIRDDFIKTKQELLILASIVEKEAKTDEERPIIASVYLNRLKKGMRLQADPTSIYEITKGRYKMTRPLTIKDTQVKGDYNTYRKKGLPIKPICNPGVNSILAALYPMETDYLYFVAKGDLNGHLFASTYNEHLKNIKAVREDRLARAGAK